MKRFNVRVYGLWVKESQVLISEETIKGKKFTKFPGGGLEWGEGTTDALKREWQEEMNLDINVDKHFYTTDYFQKSAWDDSQVISIYYFVEPGAPIILPYNNGNEFFYFTPIKDLVKHLDLPIDIRVAEMLVQHLQDYNKEKNEYPKDLSFK